MIFSSNFLSVGKRSAYGLAAFGVANLIVLASLNSCRQAPAPPSVPIHAQDGELHFDTRYLDSLNGPQSARTQREMAIYGQLRRLEMSKKASARESLRLKTNGRKEPSDSVFESVNGGPRVGFRNQVALDADIKRKIDSLKTLENTPSTPH